MPEQDHVGNAGKAAARILAAAARPDPGHEGQAFPEHVEIHSDKISVEEVKAARLQRLGPPVNVPKPRGPMNGSPIIYRLIGTIATFQFKSGRELIGKLVTVDHQGWGILDTSYKSDGTRHLIGTPADSQLVINVRQAEVIA